MKSKHREHPTTATINIQPSEDWWETGTRWKRSHSLPGVTFQLYFSLAHQELRSEGGLCRVNKHLLRIYRAQLAVISLQLHKNPHQGQKLKVKYEDEKSLDSVMPWW